MSTPLREPLVKSVSLGFGKQELNTRLADSSARPSDHNQISTLIDISMELLLPDMELRVGNITEMAQMVNQSAIASPSSSRHRTFIIC